MASPKGPPRRRCARSRHWLGATLAALLGASPSPAAAFDKAPETNGRMVTSWLPVTTAFPSSPGCSDLVWSYVPNTLAVWDPGYGISVDAEASCQPRAVTTWWDAERLGRNSLTTLSLGPLTCPEAYYTARTSVKDPSSTFVGCCPSYVTLPPHDVVADPSSRTG